MKHITALKSTKWLYSIKARLPSMSSDCHPRLLSSKHWALSVSHAARSRQPWTGLHIHQAKTPETKRIKTTLQYVL